MASVKTDEKEKNKKAEIEVSVNSKAFNDACQRVYKRRVKRISIPGFRVGKAPRKVIEKMYGEKIFYQDAAEEVYPKALDDAIKEKELDVVSVESIDTLEIDAHKGFKFKAVCILKPDVEIKDYKGLKATVEEIKVKEKDVKAKLDELRDRSARLITVEDRPAKKGDIVKLDFEGFVGGKPFEGGKAQNYSLTLGSGRFIKGFEEQVEGVKVGDRFEVKVKFPKDYSADNLKGKDAVFKCKLNEIQYKELPELDDEFAKDVSEFDTLNELKNSIKKEIKEDIKKGQDALIENQLVDGLLQNMKADIPRVMIDKRIDALMEQMKQRLAFQGLNLKDYNKVMGKNENEFRAQLEDQAKRQVRCRLALEKIARLENIEVSREDIEEEYKKLAKDSHMTLKDIKKYIKQSDIKSDLTADKALELVKETAQVEEKKAETKKAAPKENGGQKSRAKKADPKTDAAKTAKAKKTSKSKPNNDQKQ